jgi:hypothetical protein
LGHVKNPSFCGELRAAGEILFSFLPSLIEVSRAGRCGVPMEITEGNYSKLGHRGPVYKGLGAMNPCDNLTNLTVIVLFELSQLLKCIRIFILIFTQKVC